MALYIGWFVERLRGQIWVLITLILWSVSKRARINVIKASSFSLKRLSGKKKCHGLFLWVALFPESEIEQALLLANARQKKKACGWLRICRCNLSPTGILFGSWHHWRACVIKITHSSGPIKTRVLHSPLQIMNPIFRKAHLFFS